MDSASSHGRAALGSRIPVGELVPMLEDSYMQRYSSVRPGHGAAGAAKEARSSGYSQTASVAHES